MAAAVVWNRGVVGRRLPVSISSSMPALRDSGALKMIRDEQEPAVTVACRLRMSM